MLTKSIPPKLRAELAADPFYRTCCIADADCSGRIEWHHNLTYAGQRINAKFCILPACAWHHARARLKAIKDRLDRVMLSRATVEDLAQFPRFDWVQRKRYLGLV